MKMKSMILVIISLVLLVASCSKPQASCAELTQEYRDQVMQLADKWDSANALANNSPRMQLVTPISSLQNIRNEYNNLTVPECAQKTHASMLNYMDATIDGFMAFLSDEDDNIVNSHFTRADQYFSSWNVEFAKLSIVPTP
jgi:hypothetical protein